MVVQDVQPAPNRPQGELSPPARSGRSIRPPSAPFRAVYGIDPGKRRSGLNDRLP